MPIEEFLKSLELPKKYYDSNFDISEKYVKKAPNGRLSFDSQLSRDNIIYRG